MLFLFAKRLTNWEKPLPVPELQKREFKAKDGGPDLRPSLHELADEPAAHVRAYAEHATKFEPPDRRGLLLGMGGTNHEAISTPGTGSFSFTKDSHREFELRDATELTLLIKHIAADTDARRREVPLEDVEQYVRAKLAAKDPEWQSAASAPNVKKWVRALKETALAEPEGTT